ncbi:MAG: hypothetical protein QNI96_12015 [Woeseiaceae bacterium]|nr:hypothetical protein [Woeseiaceae bacterium]
MRRATFVTGIIALLALPLGALADGHEGDEQPPLSDVWIIVPKAGMEAEFNAAIEKHVAFRKEQGESRDWNGFRVVIGDNLRPVMFRHCCFNWADQDSYIAEESLEAIGADYQENVFPYVDHAHHYFEETDRENSYWPEGDATGGPYYWVTTLKWNADTGPGPGEAREKISQLALEHGWGEAGNNWLWVTRVGGAPMVMIVGASSDFAGMADPDPDFYTFMTEKMGSSDELDELFAQYRAGMKSVNSSLWRRDESISTPED